MTFLRNEANRARDERICELLKAGHSIDVTADMLKADYPAMTRGVVSGIRLRRGGAAVFGTARRRIKDQPHDGRPARKNGKQLKGRETQRAIHGGGGALARVRRGECLWPCGHPGGAGFHFCRAAALSYRPYCGRHCAKAYQGKVA